MTENLINIMVKEERSKIKVQKFNEINIEIEIRMVKESKKAEDCEEVEQFQRKNVHLQRCCHIRR